MAGLHTPFGFSSTTQDVTEGVDLTGKRVIITGASSGIGIETARALAAAGAEVVLAVRNVDAGEKTAEQIRGERAAPPVGVSLLDLADLDSVSAFAESWSGPLDILVNNAGIMAVPELERSPQGHELQFATNFLGHFALTAGLHAALAAAKGARVVSVSSNAHQFAQGDFDDPDFLHRQYHPLAAYAQSKAAGVLLAVAVTQRWSGEGIYANALNPGAIATGLQKYTGGLQTPVDRRKTVAQGAATSVLLAASPLLEEIGGRYFEDCNEAPLVRGDPVPFGGGAAPWALDPANADRLWDLAATMITR